LPDDIRNEVVQFKDAYRVDEDDLMRKHQELYGNYFLWNEEYASMITPETIKTSTLVGKPDEIIDTVRRLESQGINQIMIAPLPDPVQSIDSFHDNIMSKY